MGELGIGTRAQGQSATARGRAEKFFSRKIFLAGVGLRPKRKTH